jgi:hypothetical protein
VRVRHEIATKPGVLNYEQVLDPAKDSSVRVEGGKVVAFPALPDTPPPGLNLVSYRVITVHTPSRVNG